MLFHLSYTGGYTHGRIRTCDPLFPKYPESPPPRTLALLQRMVDAE